MTGSQARRLTAAAAPGGGLSAGVNLAFTTVLTPGLRKLPSAHAISAMNSIDKAAPGNPLLMLVPFGTGIVWPHRVICVPTP